jgi:hypothetical protein
VNILLNPNTYSFSAFCLNLHPGWFLISMTGKSLEKNVKVKLGLLEAKVLKSFYALMILFNII